MWKKIDTGTLQKPWINSPPISSNPFGWRLTAIGEVNAGESQIKTFFKTEGYKLKLTSSRAWWCAASRTPHLSPGSRPRHPPAGGGAVAHWRRRRHRRRCRPGPAPASPTSWTGDGDDGTDDLISRAAAGDGGGEKRNVGDF